MLLYIAVHSETNIIPSLREKYPYSKFFWSECGKIRTRKTPNTDTFHAVYFAIIATKMCNRVCRFLLKMYIKKTNSA